MKEEMERAVKSQMGCMAGFLQIFDRHQIYAARHFTSFPSPVASCSSPSEQSESSISSASKKNDYDSAAWQEFIPLSTQPLPVFEVSQGRSSWKLREAPRLSLDSKLSPRSTDSTRSDPPTRSPSVVAKLMGLDALPSQGSAELRRSLSDPRGTTPSPSDPIDNITAVRSSPPPRRHPVNGHRSLIDEHHSPVNNLNTPINCHNSPINGHKTPIVVMKPARNSKPSITSEIAAFTITRQISDDEGKKPSLLERCDKLLATVAGAAVTAEEQQPSPVSVLDGAGAFKLQDSGDTWQGFNAARWNLRALPEDDMSVVIGTALSWDMTAKGGNCGEMVTETSDVVLAVERLIYKDLIGEVIRDLAAAVDWRHRRRCLSVAFPRRRQLLF